MYFNHLGVITKTKHVLGRGENKSVLKSSSKKNVVEKATREKPPLEDTL